MQGHAKNVVNRYLYLQKHVSGVCAVYVLDMLCVLRVYVCCVGVLHWWAVMCAVCVRVCVCGVCVPFMRVVRGVRCLPCVLRVPARCSEQRCAVALCVSNQIFLFPTFPTFFCAPVPGIPSRGYAFPCLPSYLFIINPPSKNIHIAKKKEKGYPLLFLLFAFPPLLLFFYSLFGKW